MIRPGGPIRFLLGIVGLWCVGRTAMLWPPSMASLPEMIFAAPLPAPPPARTAARGPSIRIALADPPALVIALDPPEPGIGIPGDRVAAAAPAIPPQTFMFHLPTAVEQPGEARASAPPARLRAQRWSASSWAIARPGGGQDALAAGGLLGGSQAGLRLSYALGDRSGLAFAARLSSPLGATRGGREAAFGIDWRPVAPWPLSLTFERRVALDRRGRDAFAIGLASGVDRVPLAAGFRLDGYGQAGVVGIRSRDVYVDGALRIERPVWERGGASLALGAGAWGAAQPGASRFDLGPQAVLRLPTGITTFRVSIDWRQRIAGKARPGSGPALSVGADF